MSTGTPAADTEAPASTQGEPHGNEARPEQAADPDEGRRQEEALLIEQHRHRCEVRWCIRNGADWFKDYIKAVRQQRGQEAAQLLWDDVKHQARLGSRGGPGEWKEPKQ